MGDPYSRGLGRAGDLPMQLKFSMDRFRPDRVIYPPKAYLARAQSMITAGGCQTKVWVRRFKSTLGYVMKFHFFLAETKII